MSGSFNARTLGATALLLMFLAYGALAGESPQRFVGVITSVDPSAHTVTIGLSEYAVPPGVSFQPAQPGGSHTDIFQLNPGQWVEYGVRELSDGRLQLSEPHLHSEPQE